MTIRKPDWKTGVVLVLITACVATVSLAYSALERRTTVSESRLLIVESGVTARTERVAVVEVEQEKLEGRFMEINAKLDQIIQMHMNANAVARAAKEPAGGSR
jgi:phage shock protein A